jgi:hypothetical protein
MRMNFDSYPVWSGLSRPSPLPPKGTSSIHIDIDPFLWQGLPQATVAGEFENGLRKRVLNLRNVCPMRLGGCTSRTRTPW